MQSPGRVSIVTGHSVLKDTALDAGGVVGKTTR